MSQNTKTIKLYIVGSDNSSKAHFVEQLSNVEHIPGVSFVIRHFAEFTLPLKDDEMLCKLPDEVGSLIDLRSKSKLIARMIDRCPPLGIDHALVLLYRRYKVLIEDLELEIKQASKESAQPKVEQATCPTPLTKEEIKQISLQKSPSEKTVYFRYDTEICKDSITSTGVNLDSLGMTLNFIDKYIDFDEATFFRTKEDLLAYEEYHDVIVPIGDIEVVSKTYTNAEMTAAYQKCYDKTHAMVSLANAKYSDTLDAEQIANRVTAITRHIELLRDAREILEGNIQITEEYLKG
jgi:hypothetical protein